MRALVWTACLPAVASFVSKGNTKVPRLLTDETKYLFVQTDESLDILETGLTGPDHQAKEEEPQDEEEKGEFFLCDDDKDYMPPAFSLVDDDFDFESYDTSTGEYAALTNDDEIVRELDKDFHKEDAAVLASARKTYQSPSYAAAFRQVSKEDNWDEADSFGYFKASEYDDEDEFPEAPDADSRPSIYAKKRSNVARSSWQEKNRRFSEVLAMDQQAPRNTRSNRRGSRPDMRQEEDEDTSPTASRVTVQNIPADVDWSQLKRHFSIAGNVVFSQVVTDSATGASKGQGFVQFQTPSMAQAAIRIMPDHPLQGNLLHVTFSKSDGTDQDPTLPSPSGWTCAEHDVFSRLSKERFEEVVSILEHRAQARRRRDYQVADRDKIELVSKFGVYLDDKSKTWWLGQNPWKQAPTEHDERVDSNLVFGLLLKRDKARKERRFAVADKIFEEIKDAALREGLAIMVDDRTREWYIVTKKKYNTGPSRHQGFLFREPEEKTESAVTKKKEDKKKENMNNKRMQAAKECLEIVKEYNPSKLDKMVEVLKERENDDVFHILDRVKEHYLPKHN